MAPSPVLPDRFCGLLDHAQIRTDAATGFGQSAEVSRFQSERGLAIRSVGRLVVALAGACAAECAAVANNFALEVYAFAAFGTEYARAFEAGQIFGLDRDPHPFFVEK